MADKVRPAGINNGSFVGVGLQIIEGAGSSPFTEERTQEVVVARLAGMEVAERVANTQAVGLEEANTAAGEPMDRPQSFE